MADVYINGAADDQATVAAMNFTVTKVWRGFTPESANGSNWVVALTNYLKSGAFDCTFTWDYTDSSVIVIDISYAWADATFNQTYEVRAISGTLADYYNIGIGVDASYLNVTSMVTE